MMVSVCTVHAQGIGFTYDASGNQILRETNYSRNRGIDIERDSVSTDRMWRHEVTATPNPTEGSLRVIVTHLQDDDNSSLALFDAAGRQVLSRVITSEVTFINLSSLIAGYYVLRVTVNGETESIKIIKE